MQKNAKKCKKICVYEKFVVILHQNLKIKPKFNKIKPKSYE